jgi:ribosomal-protein-alanine N-acetyltransferase
MRPPLLGPRIELRPFEPSDVHAAHRVYTDERVMRWVGTGVVGDLEQTRAILAEYIRHQRLHGFSVWAVIERATNELIGDAGLYTRGSEVELGYTLGFEHWGRGYGTEAAGLWVRAGLGELRLPGLIALIRPENAASAALASKLGFEPRGRVSAYGAEHVLYRLTNEASGPDSARSSDPSSRRSPSE